MVVKIKAKKSVIIPKNFNFLFLKTYLNAKENEKKIPQIAPIEKHAKNI